MPAPDIPYSTLSTSAVTVASLDAAPSVTSLGTSGVNTQPVYRVTFMAFDNRDDQTQVLTVTHSDASGNEVNIFKNASAYAAGSVTTIFTRDDGITISSGESLKATVGTAPNTSPRMKVFMERVSP